MRVLECLLLLTCPALLQAQWFTKGSKAPPPPVTPAAVHIVKGGERTPYELKSPVTLDGAVTVEIGPGRVSYKALNFSYAPTATVRIVGAGREQTLLERDGGSHYVESLQTGGATVILQSMTVKALSVVSSPPLKRKRDASVLLVDCDVIGPIYVPASGQNEPRLEPTYFVGAVLSRFDEPLQYHTGADNYKGYPILVAYSWTIDAKRRAKPVHSPQFGFAYFEGMAKMAEAAERWTREARYEDRLGAGNMRIIAATSPAMLTALARMKMSSPGHAEHITRVVRSGVTASLALGPTLADPPALQRALAQAADYRGRQLRAMESLALQQALGASGMQPDSSLQALLDANRRVLASTYGCYVSFDVGRTKTPSTTPVDTFQLLRHVRNDLRALSDLFAMEYEPGAACQIRVGSIVDFFVGADQSSAVQTTSVLEESQASLLRKQRAKEAAEAAAAQAAKARLEGIANSLGNTAKQIAQERPRIENIGSGTYLVIDRQANASGPSAADAQRTAAATNRYSDAARRYASAKSEMVEIKTRTTTFWRNRRDGVQFELYLSHRDGFKRHIVAPYEESKFSQGPCKYTQEERFIGLYNAPLQGPCTPLIPNHPFREQYYGRNLSGIIHEFVLEQHLAAILSEAAGKATSSDDATRLDGMLLAYLVSDKVDVREIEGLAKRVLGVDVSADALRKRVIFN